MGLLKRLLNLLKKKAIKEAKGAVGLKKNQKVTTSVKKGIKNEIKDFFKP